MGRITSRYSCDFETTTDPKDCRVWAWVAINIDDTERRYYGNTIAGFIKWCEYSNKTLYFHNLKFDGEFILSYLMLQGFTLNTMSKFLKPRQFNTLISGQGQFYTLTICFENANIKIIDSLKLLPYSVAAIAKGFHLEISKLTIDYKAYRAPNHELTEQEKDYITNDALIVAQGLKVLFNEGFKKITAGSNAFSFYQKSIGGEVKFRKFFPVLSCDDFIRKAYKGGFTYAAPQFQNKEVGAGRVYDVNSLYPFSLHSPHLYPYGQPQYYTGEYKPVKDYPLFVQHFTCQFKAKKNHLPMIQLKNSRSFIPTEYISDSGTNDVELYLTSVDYALFFDHYDVYNITFIDGYCFKAVSGMFDGYIDHWFAEKTKAKEEKNFAMYQLSKLMQNSLYGKFATNPACQSKWPNIDENGRVYYTLGGIEYRDPIYVPVGAFCTSYARDVTIRAAQLNFDRFMYADTDSLHLNGDYDPIGVNVDEYELGAFKHEGTFTKAKYLRAKMYMELIRDPDEQPGSEKWKVTGAGMPDHCKELVTFEKFNFGESFPGKLRPIHVPGGIVFEEIPFTIRG